MKKTGLMAVVAAGFLSTLGNAPAFASAGLDPLMVQRCDMQTLEATDTEGGFVCRTSDGEVCSQYCGNYQVEDGMGFVCAYYTAECDRPVAHPHPGGHMF